MVVEAIVSLDDKGVVTVINGETKVKRALLKADGSPIIVRWSELGKVSVWSESGLLKGKSLQN